MERLWRYVRKDVLPSLGEYRQPVPAFPTDCPFTLARLVDEDLDHTSTVDALRTRWSGG